MVYAVTHDVPDDESTLLGHAIETLAPVPGARAGTVAAVCNAAVETLTVIDRPDRLNAAISGIGRLMTSAGVRSALTAALLDAHRVAATDLAGSNLKRAIAALIVEQEEPSAA